MSSEEEMKEFRRKRSAATLYPVLGAVTLSLFLFLIFAALLSTGLDIFVSLAISLTLTVIVGFFLARAIRRKTIKIILEK